jgi:nondiscriminating glutamyl-tRNA synthetase
LNYISLLGWNPKTTEEIFSLSQLIDRFKLEDVHRAGAVFDVERLDWFNAKYIVNYELATLWNKLKTYLGRYDSEYLEKISSFDEQYILKILSELQTRMKKLEDFKTLTEFFFEDVKDVNTELIVNKKMKIETLSDVKTALQAVLEILGNRELSLTTPEEIKNTFIEEIKKREMKNGQVLWPARVALSMQEFSPGALELIYIFGREKSIERIQKVLKQI